MHNLANITVAYDQLVVLVLIFFRIFSVFFFAPIFGNESIPITIKMSIAVIVTFILYPITPHPAGLADAVDILSLVFLVAKEICIGMILGFSAMMAMSVMQFTGGILGRIMGLREGNLIDPLFNEGTGELSQFQFTLFILLFLGANAHHYIISIISKSFSVVPLGSLVIRGALIVKFVEMIGNLFVLGIQYAGPIMAFVLITSLAFGILGKAIPEMNLLILMLPVKIFIGLVGIIIIFPFFVHFVSILIRTFYKDLATVLQLL